MDIKLKAPKSLISRLGHRLSGTVSSSPSWWSQNRESALASVTKVLQVTEKALDGIPAPGAKSVIGGVAEVLKTVQNDWMNEQSLIQLTVEIERIKDILYPYDATDLGAHLLVPPKMANHLFELKSQINRLLAKWNQPSGKTSLIRRLTADVIAEDVKELTRQMSSIVQALALEDQLHSGSLVREMYEMSLLDRLQPVKTASYNTAGLSTCLKGTREGILGEVSNWFNDVSETAPPIFWIYGLAGTGKTTIAATVASDFAATGRLAGSFFFSVGAEVERRDLPLIIPTIAYQLAMWHPSAFRQSLCHVIKENMNVSGQKMQQQIKLLFVDALKHISRDSIPKTALLVLDALDECDVVDGMAGGQLLPLIISVLPTLPFRLKLLVTSRPDWSVKHVLARRDPIRLFILHEIEQIVVSKDIALYLRHELARIAEMTGVGDDAWPTQEDFNRLTDQAGPLFIYASTAIKFLVNPNHSPQHQLNRLLARNGLATARTLDDLYQQIILGILRNSTDPSEIDDICTRFRKVVGAILVALEPLHILAMAELLDIRTEDIEYALRPLESVLNVSMDPYRVPVRIFHDSFPEFIADNQRCRDPKYLIDVPDTHLHMASRCLHVLHSRIAYQVTASNSASPVNNRLGLTYSVIYWLTHITTATLATTASRPIGTSYVLTVTASLDISGIIYLLSQQPKFSHLPSIDWTTPALRSKLQILTASSHVVMVHMVTEDKCAALLFIQGSAAIDIVPLPKVSKQSITDMRTLWSEARMWDRTSHQTIRSDSPSTPSQTSEDTDSLATIPTGLPQFPFKPRGRASKPLSKAYGDQPQRPERSLPRDPVRKVVLDALPASAPLDPGIAVSQKVWEQIFEPIRDVLHLKKTRGSIRPRVHWCLVGNLNFLPIHAAAARHGPGGVVHEAAWDYAVSSYIPTLDCLYQLQLKKEQQVQPLLLNPCVVAVSDAPGRPLPQVDIEAGNIVKYLDSLGQKCNILRDSQEVLDKLPSHTVLHFAGHGDWAGTECLNGGLILRDGPLPLMKLMQLNMAKPKLAYLSACSTIRREGPESALDMLLCGFASVVMSVGPILDVEAPKLAAEFYRSLSTDGKLDLHRVPYALDQAVHALRTRSNVPLRRWAMLIHVGV